MVNFEVATSAFSDITENKIFPDAEAGGGAGDPNAICSQPETADDVISSHIVETFRYYHAAVSQKIKISHACNALTAACPFGPPFSGPRSKNV